MSSNDFFIGPHFLLAFGLALLGKKALKLSLRYSTWIPHFNVFAEDARVLLKTNSQWKSHP
jgi:hypothetical protein